jgi:hypothetical protein
MIKIFRDDPKHWLDRAAKARAHAEQMSDPESECMMMEIGAARGEMQPKAPHLLRARRAGRAAQECRELLDPLHVVMLGFRRELADRHVVDHAPAQRADDLLGHWSAPVLREVRTPRSQGRTRRRATPSNLMMSGLKLAAGYRASGLVL